MDLDDVCWDLLSAWLRRYNEITFDNVEPKDVLSWDISKYINKGTKEMLFYILEQSDFWQTVNPMKDSQKYMQKLLDDGYEIYIVTSTSAETLHHKLIRFFELFPFINQHQIITAHNKQLIGVDILIDDKPENLIGGSFDKILFERTHNKWCDTESNGIFRCKDWESIYKLITEELEPRKGLDI